MRGQRKPEGGNHGPREASSTKLQAGFVANQDFSGFWTGDIHREGRSQRSAPQERHTAHLRRCTHCTPRKPSGRDAGGDKSQQQRSASTWSPELLGLGKGTKRRLNQVCAFVEYLNLSGLDLASAFNPGQASDSSWQSNLEPEQCRLGKYTCCERGQTQCG